MKWTEQANCGPESAHLFDPAHIGTNLPVVERRKELRRIGYAKAICSGCTVRTLCLQLALTEKLSGVFGGVYVRDGLIGEVTQQ